MKKILSLVLAALMVFSMIPAVFAADDAAKANSYDEAIELLGNEYVWVYHGGVAAEEDVTRAQMALFVSRFITGETDDNYWATEQNDSGFSDLEDQYEAYLGAISFASQKGIVNGYGDGTFGPEDNVEYRQAITMIVRALGFTYKASGYPWSYINKANELGLLDGITGVAYTDAASRGVVAQLLYNALFADVDGASVAEKVFSVGKTTVMITASNGVSYNGNQTVLRTGYVQFMEMDDQLEPIGAKYHVPMAQFGIADAATANAYVGTTYEIYYGGNFETILIAEHNDYDVFWNYGNDKTEITVAKADKAKESTLTLGSNAALKIVSQYSNLVNNQGWDADAAGLAQVKVYLNNMTLNAGYVKEYYLVGNVIYKAADLSTVAVFSEVTNRWYFVVDGIFAEADQDAIDALLLGNANGVGGVATAAATSAYTKVLASDNNADGLYDKAYIRNYQFGTITKDGSKSTLTKGNAANGFVAAGDKADRAWTGLAASAVNSGDYAVYYADDAEIEVLFTVPAKSAETTDTYYAYGYVRAINYDANTITVGSEVLNVGYDALQGTALKASKTANRAYLADFFNQYVKYVVVDDKVVYVEAANIDTNYVIIDKFVGFTEDGIVAEGWSTVANGYTTFTVSALNGWTIKGLDFDLYFLSELIKTSLTHEDRWDPTKHMINLGLQFIPVEQGELYQIVYTEANGSLNLTAPTSQVAKNGDEWEDVGFEFTKSGFVKNTTGANDWDDAVTDRDRKYAPLTEGDFWMILVKMDERDAQGYSLTNKENAFYQNGYMVITVNGKMNANITALRGLDAYKLVKGDDYVFVTDYIDETLLKLIFTEDYADADYYMYSEDISKVSNVEFLNNTFVYTIPMINVVTAAPEDVRFEADIYDISNFQGTGYIEDLFVAGGIYKGVNGKIELDVDDIDAETGKLYSYTLCQVGEFLGDTQEGDYAWVEIGAGTNIFSYTDIIKAVAYYYADLKDIQMNDTDFWKQFEKMTTVLTVKGDKVVKITKDDNSKVEGLTLGNNETAHMDIYFVDGEKVVVWIDEIEELEGLDQVNLSENTFCRLWIKADKVYVQTEINVVKDATYTVALYNYNGDKLAEKTRVAGETGIATPVVYVDKAWADDANDKTPITMKLIVDGNVVASINIADYYDYSTGAIAPYTYEAWDLAVERAKALA